MKQPFLPFEEKTPWLVLDCDYLCHRAAFSTGELSYEGNKTGVVFGVLREVLSLQDRFNTEKIAFCWDHWKPLRSAVYPNYKANRKVAPLSQPMVADKRKEMHVQMRQLRDEILSELGYSNILFEKGYEADDILASVVKNLPDGETAIIVSSDHDLYQLLNHKVSIWNPRKKEMLREEGFRKEYKIDPNRWHCVKAIAGCVSDNIAGVSGVGEKTAVRFLQGDIKENSVVYRAILKEEETWKKNIPLVKLPYEGCPVFSLREDNVTRKKWKIVCERLGMRTLLHIAVGQVTK